MGMRIAFWKGTDPGFGGFLDRAIKWWTNGPYSHCEVIFSDGITGSASWNDKGVILKRRPEGYYDPANWDIVDIVGDEVVARAWFEKHKGAPYDLLGDFGFVFRPIKGMEGAFFCSEANAAMLDWPESWTYSPNGFYSALRVSRNVVPV